MFIIILVSSIICPLLIAASRINFDNIQQNGELYCYEYHQISSSHFDSVVIYPFASCTKQQSNDEMYTAISNLLHVDANIHIITDHRGIGIQITNPNDYSRHETIIFCLSQQLSMISDGEYCMLSNKKKHNFKHPHHKHKIKSNCHHHLLVPDICSFEPTFDPTSDPTFDPTFEPLPEEFGEVLIPGVNYTFSGGWFSINNESVIIRPNMIYQCSLRNNSVDVYGDEIDRANLTEALQIGHPLFSLLIDINAMPIQCPILFGLIINISSFELNILHIDLVELDPSLIFLNSDINITNSSVFELATLGDVLLEDTFNIIDPLINDTSDEFENITVVEDAIIFQNDTDFNFTDFSMFPERRRLLTFRASGSVSLGIRLVFSPIPQLEVTAGFRLHGGVSLLLQTSWLSVIRFRFEVAIGAVFGISAKLTAKLPIPKKRFNIRPAAIRSNHILPIFGIPILITGFHKLDISLEIEASVSAGCSFEYKPNFKGGFDCTPERGCEPIKRTPDPPSKNGCKLISYDKCQLSGSIFAHPQFGVTLYHGLFTIVHPVKAGPRLSITYPSADDIPCACPDAFELAVDLVVGVAVEIKLLNIKALRKIEKLRSILKHLSIKIFEFEAVIAGLAICFDISILPDTIADLLESKCCKSKPPTSHPSTTPTFPMAAPTFSPSTAPTIPPSTAPSSPPSTAPSSSPTDSPTMAPLPIPMPTFPPTMDPTIEPTINPTINPTIEPTVHPTIDTIPTLEPTIDPTIDPTLEPTPDPTIFTSLEPTIIPTVDPTMVPTIEPTIDPTSDPTLEPTINPTVYPTMPTLEPTLSPTKGEPPTIEPTIDPTKDPTKNPSIISTTVHLSLDPTSDPTKDPTDDPTADPTRDPTRDPTSKPTKMTSPTVDPTIDPTSDPSSDPSNDPTRDPTNDPTTDPTHQPIFHGKAAHNDPILAYSYDKSLGYFQPKSSIQVHELKVDVVFIAVLASTVVTSLVMCLVFVLCKNRLKC